MPVRKMTPQETKDWLGSGRVMLAQRPPPGWKPRPTSEKPEIKGVIDTSDPLFAALAAMPHEKKREMLKHSMAQRKARSSLKGADSAGTPAAPDNKQAES